MLYMARKHTNVVGLNGKPLESKEQVLEQLFREHGVVLRAFLAARVSPEMDLDDLVQEVFLRLARVEDLKGRMTADRGSTLSYVLTIGVNLILDLKKHHAVVDRHARREAQMTEESERQACPDVIAAAQEDLALVEEAVLQLPPVWRKVFLLSRVESMTYREIAEKMNVSVKQVEKYMSKALKRLRDAFRAAHRQEANNG